MSTDPINGGIRADRLHPNGSTPVEMTPAGDLGLLIAHWQKLDSYSLAGILSGLRIADEANRLRPAGKGKFQTDLNRALEALVQLIEQKQSSQKSREDGFEPSQEQKL
jgi:hypothetical protein